MATTNYGWIQPANGGDTNNWGIDLNNTLQAIDTVVFGIQGLADAALPATGGAMTGRLDALTSTFKIIAKGSLSGTPAAFDLSTAQAFSFTVAGTLTLALTNVPSAGASGLLLVVTNGGSATVTWPASFQFPGGSSPVLTASGKDVMCLVTTDGGVSFLMVGLQLNV